MSTKLHDVTVVGATNNVDIANGVVTSSGALTVTSGGAITMSSAVGSGMTLTSDGYLSLSSTQSGVAIDADGGDLTLVSSSTGGNIILSTGSTGEVSVRTTMKQYGTTGTMTISNSAISSTDGLALTASSGNVTLTGTNIFISGELDTSAGGLTVKANNGSSDVTITAPIATGRAGQPGLTATGGSSSANGITVTGGSTDGYGIVSTGSGTGPGILARSGDSGGYGIIAESIGSPAVRTAMRLVPQFTDPSSSEIGDVYVRNASGLMTTRAAGTRWGRHVTKVHSITSAATTSVGSDSSANIAIFPVTSSSVQAGSTVRIFIAGTSTSAVGLPTFGFNVNGTDDAAFSAQITNATNRFMAEGRFTFRTIGASGTIWGASAYDTLSLSTYARRFSSSGFSTVNTTNGVDIALKCYAAEGGADMRVDEFIVDISD